jgi:hypothetical protein
VYSTTAGTPAIQVNTGSNWLGVGKAPTVALDVVGAAAISTNLVVTGKTSLGLTGTSKNYSVNVAATGGAPAFISFYNNITNWVKYEYFTICNALIIF